MPVGKDSCIIKVVVPKHIKDLIKKFSDKNNLSISYFCYDAILEKIIKHKKEEKNAY